MYSRVETITSVNGNLVPFINTLTDKQKVDFRLLIESTLLSAAINYSSKNNEREMILFSIWPSKDAYINALSDTLAKCTLLFGTNPDIYYKDQSKFNIELVEEES